jgi:RNA polymerase sigma-70 factor, ECF subfamily
MSKMPDHGAGFTNTESHTGAAQGDTYLNCETALNYETALLECASGSQSAVGKIYAR